MTAARGRGRSRRGAPGGVPGLRPVERGALAVRTGAAIGLAAGFVVWSQNVRLWDTSYHFGGFGDHNKVIAACIAAGVSWIRCSAIGAGVGGLIGLLLAGAPAVHGPMKRGAAAATGVYLLALRGAWGYGGRPPDEMGSYPLEDGPPTPLPAAALWAPLLLAAAAAAAILWRARRAERDRGGTADGEEDSMHGIVVFHACFSLAAAHLTVQLPYYIGAWEPFLVGLRDLVAVLPGV